jgi:hypothetical protein
VLLITLNFQEWLTTSTPKLDDVPIIQKEKERKANPEKYILDRERVHNWGNS